MNPLPEQSPVRLGGGRCILINQTHTAPVVAGLHDGLLVSAAVLASFRGACLLEPIACIVPEVLPLPFVRLRPRDFEPKTSRDRHSTDCDRWSPGVSEAPWRRDLPFLVMSQRERIDSCLESQHPDVWALAFSPNIYTDETKISCGSFIPASMTGFVARGYDHENLMRQAGVFEYRKRSDVSYYEPYEPAAYKEPEHEKAIADMTPEEREAALAELQSTSGEISGIEVDADYRRPTKPFKRNPNAWDNRWNPRFTDDEDTSGTGLLEHIIDVSRDTNKPSATALLSHSDLKAVREFAKTEPPSFPIGIYMRYHSIRETAEKMGIAENALQKRVTNYFEEAAIMCECKIPYHLIKNPLTEGQLEAVREGAASFILLRLNDEWVWRELDMKTHGTVGQAVAAFRLEAEMNALGRQPGWKKANQSKVLQTQAIRTVKGRYDDIFKRAFVLSTRPGWRGVLGQLAESEGD